MENKFIGCLERDGYRGSSDVVVYHKFGSDPRATLAVELVKHFGVIAATVDGEDSAGRQKIRQQESSELVDRACQIADLLFAQFEEREWLLPLPAPKVEERAASKA